MQGIGDCRLSAHPLPLGHPGLVHQQNGVVDHQPEQDDEADDGEQVHRQRRHQTAQVQRQHAAYGGEWQGEQHQHGILEGGEDPPQQNEQYHHGEQEDAAEVAERLLQAVGIAGDPQLPPGRQQRPDGGKALVLQGVEHLLHAHPRRGRNLQADAAPPIGSEDALRPELRLHPQQFPKGNDAPGRGSKRHRLELVRVGGGLPHQQDVEPLIPVEIFADPQTIAKGLDDGGHGGAIPAHLGQAPVLGHQPKLGSGEIESGFWPDLGAGQVPLHYGHALPGRLIEFGQPTPLDQQGDAVFTVKTAKQGPLTAKHPGVGNAHQQLLHQELLQRLDLVILLWPHPDLGTARVAQDVVVLEDRLLLPFHIGVEAGNQGIDHLLPLGLEIDPGGETHPDVDGVPLHIRQVVHLGQHQPAHQHRPRHHQDDDGPAPGGGGRPADHMAGDAAPQALKGINQPLVPHPARRHRRQHRDRHHHGDGHRAGDGERKIGKQLPFHVVELEHRQEDGDRGQGGRHQSGPHPAGALQRRLSLADVTPLMAPVDALQHHDGGVEHHADRKRNARQGDDIEGPPHHLEQAEGEHDADGNGDRDHQGRLELAQKDPEDGAGEQHPEPQVGGHHAHRPVDVEGSVKRLLHVQADRLQHLPVELPDLGLDPLERRQGIGAALLEDLRRDGGVAVLDAQHRVLLPGHSDLGNVPQIDGQAVTPVHHLVPQGRHVIATGKAQLVLPASDVEGAGRHIPARRCPAGEHRDLHPQLGGAVRVETDLDLALVDPLDVDRGHPGDPLQLGLDPRLDQRLVIVYLPLGAGQLLDEEEGQGVVAAVVVDVRTADVVRQPRDPVQAGDDVKLGPLHVGAEGKLHVDFGEAGVAVAAEALEPLYPLHLLLDGIGYLRLHLLGRGRTPVHRDVEVRTVYVGKQLDGQSPDAEQAQQKNQHDRDRHPDGAFDRRFGEVHSLFLSCCYRPFRWPCFLPQGWGPLH